MVVTLNMRIRPYIYCTVYPLRMFWHRAFSAGVYTIKCLFVSTPLQVAIYIISPFYSEPALVVSHPCVEWSILLPSYTGSYVCLFGLFRWNKQGRWGSVYIYILEAWDVPWWNWPKGRLLSNEAVRRQDWRWRYWDLAILAFIVF